MSIKQSVALFGTFLVIFSFSAAGVARADWLIDRSGTLIEVDGSILGDEDEANEIKVEDAINQDSSDSPANDNSDDHSKDRGVMVRNTGQLREQAKDLEEQRRESAKKRLEVATEARIKTQEARKEKIKSHLEIKDGAVRVRQEVENEAGKLVRSTETDVPIRERFRIEQENGEMVEISATQNDKLEIIRNHIKARTDLPLSVGDNNELIITRPDGTEKIVTVLPDTAADNLRERGLSVTNNEVELEQEGETPVYRFKTKEVKRLFGLFRREYAQETTVSAESGEVISSESPELSPLQRLLKRLSF